MRQSLLVCSIVSFLLVFGASDVSAQNYRLAFGARVGQSNGVSVKYITKELQGVEGIFHFQNGGMRLTGMYEGMLHAKKRSFTSGMHLIYGAGAHIASYSNYKRVTPLGTEFIDYVGFGIDVKLGFEYCLKAPLTIGMELKPFYEITSEEDVANNFMDFTLTIRHSVF